MKIKVVVDKTLCIGYGKCEQIDINHFEVQKDGKARVRKSKDEKGKNFEEFIEITPERYKKVLEAAKKCPTQAISIIDETGNQLFP